jgi:GntR family transcriptional regulator
VAAASTRECEYERSGGTGEKHDRRRGDPPPAPASFGVVDHGCHGAIMSSTMRSVKVDRSEPTPLHEQVAAEIRRAVAEGEAKPGERLPPARDVAAVLGVNRNTVFRAFRLLRDEGLLEFRRGRGVTVAGTPERGAVTAKAIELIAFAREQGYRRDELVRLIESLPG